MPVSGLKLLLLFIPSDPFQVSPWFYYPFEAHLDQSLKYCNLAVLVSDEPAWNIRSSHENKTVSR